MRAVAVLIVLCTACGIAAAQNPLYRSTMPDGKVVISDQPARGATKVEELKPRAGNYAPGGPVKGGAAPAPDRAAARDAAEKEMKAAQAAYDAAVARAEKGKEEVEGDRVGTYKGGSRRSEAYDKRQESLKADVDTAKANLEAARKQFNDAR